MATVDYPGYCPDCGCSVMFVCGTIGVTHSCDQATTIITTLKKY